MCVVAKPKANSTAVLSDFILLSPFIDKDNEITDNAGLLFRLVKNFFYVHLKAQRWKVVSLR